MSRVYGSEDKFFQENYVGKSDSGNYTAAWKEKFSHAPTWCDADMSLQQINRNMARGNRIALYSRTFFQKNLYRLGDFIQRWPWTVAIISLILYTICCAGLKEVTIEVDIVKLWVPQGGRLDEEMHYLSRVHQEISRVRRDTAEMPPPIIPTVHRGNHKNGTHPKKAQKPQQQREWRGPELPKENGLGGGFQVVIQTPEHPGESSITKAGLLKHVRLMEEVAQYEVELYGENWTLADICFKPPQPDFSKSPLAKILSSVLSSMIPCIWITPIDCFWEGAKPLGPRPPINLGPAATSFITSLPKGNVTWKNLNPSAVMGEVSQLFDLGPVSNFFERAGIDSAYLDRPCIDPLDPECPKTSPNYFDRCSALKKFNSWNAAQPQPVILETEKIEDDEDAENADQLLAGIFGKKRRKRQAETTKAPAKKAQTKSEDYYDYENDADYSADNITLPSEKKKKGMSAEEKDCLEHGKAFVLWMAANQDKWSLYLPEAEFPKDPNYGEIMTGGCKGFGKKIMEWPEDLIIGGIERDGEKVKSAEALQSVFLVASPYDVYVRYKEPKPELKPKLDTSRWGPGMAGAVIATWQRHFTRQLYDHPANKENPTNRVFHPLASTSIGDMLEEFSQFNYIIIIIGYFLMILYAAWTQCRIKGWWLAVQSNVLLSFIGTMLVTYSSICGLGVTTWLGINFNAATTQIVPFLSLGLGIDDMFLLLHNYDEIINTVRKDEMGVLLKETGLSVMVTSLNNVLSFFAGTVLPVPALRSFCLQTAILLIFNLLSLVIIFPAFIALDLRRLRKGKRDLGYCFPATEDPAALKANKTEEARAESENSKAHLKSLDSESHLSGEKQWERNQPWYTVGGFLTNIYIPALQTPKIKFLVMFLTVGMTGFGLYGMYTGTLGLELSDVLPEHTAPAAFLRAREKYFSFYPMFAVLRGTEIDIPNQQEQIEEYRRRLGETKFMILKDGKNAQPYWMSLLRVWLESLDVALEKEISNDVFNLTTGKINKGKKPTPEGQIAQKLVCSVGHVFNCTGRLGNIKLVNNGIIRPEAFYNYLTAWFNVDNMMYYVSQASFAPNPPVWRMNARNEPVPPARKLLHSQIPFYQTGLTDTPVIVNMIEEVREVCENYTSHGLSNFPSGIAFTFWDQYLELRWNLFIAICYIAFAVFVVISVLMFNPRAAVMVMVIVVILTIQLGGFMGLFGVKMNGISAVTQICAVGIGVEFTAHVVLCFLTSLGTVDDRIESCLQHMFVPVFHGAISTFLGIVMLIFSQFDFVIKYFFVTMTVLVALGLWNGLCVLPVLLSWFGPEPELIPTDGSKRLPAPPPLAQQNLTEKKALESGLRNRKGDVEMTQRAETSSSGSSEQ
ncbi:unnamed protein product, partial [Mesorhabditis belari]|uniref:SSD domain-containing protein n=1 Tax=Mesorhabditis belari TaxID=2138241 RepID=A0AAF3J7V4_9BILA